jgi:hypothetical protein
MRFRVQGSRGFILRLSGFGHSENFDPTRRGQAGFNTQKHYLRRY